jgi:hypothetical protein
MYLYINECNRKKAYCTSSACNSVLFIFISDGISDFHEMKRGLVLYEYDM